MVSARYVEHDISQGVDIHVHTQTTFPTSRSREPYHARGETKFPTRDKRAKCIQSQAYSPDLSDFQPRKKEYHPEPLSITDHERHYPQLEYTSKYSKHGQSRAQGQYKPFGYKKSNTQRATDYTPRLRGEYRRPIPGLRKNILGDDDDQFFQTRASTPYYGRRGDRDSLNRQEDFDYDNFSSYAGREDKLLPDEREVIVLESRLTTRLQDQVIDTAEALYPDKFFSCKVLPAGSKHCVAGLWMNDYQEDARDDYDIENALLCSDWKRRPHHAVQQLKDIVESLADNE